MNEVTISYEWIETLPELEPAAGTLGGAEMIGVDLESDSMYHYFEKVCLLQIATESASYLLDTLALKDLSPLRPVFSDPRVRKVFHGADYDIRSLYRDFRLEIENLFDTQLACRFLGLPESGLDALLRDLFQVKLNKKYQRADWSQRPLSGEMLQYAAMDGRYLIPLARKLEHELEEKGRLAWFEEECVSLARVRFLPPRKDPLYLRVKGAYLLDRRSLAVLQALLTFREAQARKLDLPPFKMMGNEPLLQLALKKPSTLEDLRKEKILSPKQMDRYGKHLLREIERAMALPAKDLPAYPRPERPDWPAAVRKRVKALKAWRDLRAKSLGMEPGLLLNNALINDLAVRNPASIEELEEIPGLKNWRRTHFGREIVDARRSGSGNAG